MASRDAGNVLRPVAYLVGAVSDAQQQDAFHLAVASRQEMEETLYLLNSLPCLHDFVKEVSRRTRYKRVGVLQTVSAVLGRINVNTHRKKSGAERAPPQQHQQTAAVTEAAKLPVSKRTLQVTQRILSDLVVFATGTRRGDPFDPSLVRCEAAAVCVWCSVHAHAGCRVCVWLSLCSGGTATAPATATRAQPCRVARQGAHRMLPALGWPRSHGGWQGHPAGRRVGVPPVLRPPAVHVQGNVCTCAWR